MSGMLTPNITLQRFRFAKFREMGAHIFLTKSLSHMFMIWHSWLIEMHPSIQQSWIICPAKSLQGMNLAPSKRRSKARSNYSLQRGPYDCHIKTLEYISFLIDKEKIFARRQDLTKWSFMVYYSNVQSDFEALYKTQYSNHWFIAKLKSMMLKRLKKVFIQTSQNWGVKASWVSHITII